MDSSSLFNVKVRTQLPLAILCDSTDKSSGQSRPGDRRSKRHWPHDLRRFRAKRSKSLHLLPRRQSLRASLQRAERPRYLPPPFHPLNPPLTLPRQRLRARHPRRLLQARRLQTTSRRAQEARTQTARPGQQLWLELGRALRRIPGLRLDTSADPQPNPRLHHHASRDASPRSRRHERGPGADHQHRVRGRGAGPESGDILVQCVEGGTASVEQGAGESSGEEEYHE